MTSADSKGKPYEHTFNELGVCTKCHQTKNLIEKRMAGNLFKSVCPIIGKEEVANFRIEENT